MNRQRLVLASDHAGRSLRLTLGAHLVAAGHTHLDLGCEDATPVDYPPFAARACQVLAAGEAELGLLICGTGLGMSMAANRLPGMRAAACSNEIAARLAREHNDANLLCLGARLVGVALATAILDAFLAASFAGGRHALRLSQLRALERR